MQSKTSWLKLNKASLKGAFFKLNIDKFKKFDIIMSDITTRRIDMNYNQEKYVEIGNTSVKFSDYGEGRNKNKYVISTSQRVKNILVECEYCETGRENANASYFVTIKVYGKHSNPIEIYEMYASTSNSKYNQISRCTRNDNVALGGPHLEKFEETLKVINKNFDPFTIKFISCAKKIITNKGEITKTPSFILETVEEYSGALYNQNIR